MDPFIGEIKIVPYTFAPQDWAFCNGQTVPTNQNQALFSLIGNTFGGDTNNFRLPDLKGRIPIGATTMGGTVTTSSYTLGATGGSETLQNGTIAASITLQNPISATLTTDNMPQHTHTADTSKLMSSGTVTINCNDSAGTQSTGDQAYLGKANTGSAGRTADVNAYNTTTPNKALNGGTANFSGNIGGSVTIQPSGNASPTAVSIPVNNAAASIAVTRSANSVVQPYLGLNYIIAMMGIYPTRN